MTILKNDIVLAPFIGENLSFSVGLNPLGIRTASEQCKHPIKYTL